MELGLVDAIGDLHSILRDRFGAEVVLKPIAPKRPFFALPRLGFSAQGMVEDVTTSFEDRAWWARIGL